MHGGTPRRDLKPPPAPVSQSDTFRSGRLGGWFRSSSFRFPAFRTAMGGPETAGCGDTAVPSPLTGSHWPGRKQELIIIAFSSTPPFLPVWGGACWKGLSPAPRHPSLLFSVLLLLSAHPLQKAENVGRNVLETISVKECCSFPSARKTEHCALKKHKLCMLNQCSSPAPARRSWAMGGHRKGTAKRERGLNDTRIA